MYGSDAIQPSPTAVTPPKSQPFAIKELLGLTSSSSSNPSNDNGELFESSIDYLTSLITNQLIGLLNRHKRVGERQQSRHGQTSCNEYHHEPPGRRRRHGGPSHRQSHQECRGGRFHGAASFCSCRPGRPGGRRGPSPATFCPTSPLITSSFHGRLSSSTSSPVIHLTLH